MGHVVGRRGFVIAGALLASAGFLWWSATRDRERAASVESSLEATAEIARTPENAAAAAAEARESLANGVAPGETPAHRIRGRVLEPDGAPASAAAVWVEVDGLASEHAGTFAVCDATGAFELATRANASVVHAWSETSAELALDVRFEKDGEARDLGTVRLARGGVIRGRVVGVGGKPRAHVQLRALARQGSQWTLAFAGHPLRVGYRDAESDAEGRFVLSGLRPVAHDVALVGEPLAECLAPAKHEQVFPDGDEVVFAAEADGHLRARVVDMQTAEPIARFRIDSSDEVVSDTGAFERDVCVERGVSIAADGYFGSFTNGDELRTLLDTADARIELMPLPKLGTLLVTARNLAGEPVPAPRVCEWRYRNWVDAQLAHAELAPGVVRVSGLFYGPHELYIDAPGHNFTKTKLRIEQGREAELEVVLERSARVRVRVLDALGLVAQHPRIEIDGERRKERDYAWISLRTDVVQTLPRPARTNSGETLEVELGNAWIAGLPAGKYTLLVHVADDDVREFPFEVVLDEEKSYEFACGARENVKGAEGTR